jgi:hypothetical protein
MPIMRAFAYWTYWGALALCCFAPHAEAQAVGPSRRSFDIEYSAPAGCPDRAEFVAAILARVPTAFVADSETAAVGLRAQVTADGRSTLWIKLENGSSQRNIDGASCKDAVASMALIAGMVLEAEPEARLSTADLAVTAAEADQAEPTNQARAADSSSPKSVGAVQTKAPASVEHPLPRSDSWGSTVSLGSMAESAVASTPPLGLAAGAQLFRRSTDAWGIVGRAELLATLPATQHGAGGAAELRLLAARLGACAQRRLSPRWGLLPCVTFDAGQLYANGTEVLAEQRATMPWLAFGVSLLAHYDVNRSWGVEAALGAKRLTRHDRFYFRPNSTVYDVPPFSVGATVGLNFRIF